MLIPKFTTYGNETDITMERVYKKIEGVQDFSYNFFEFEDPKKTNRYVKKIESIIRQSLEYRRYIKYLKNEIELTSCNFFKGIDTEEINGVGIEFHHYPFTLYDITYTVLSDMTDYFTKPVNTFDVANEVMKLHYENIIGLIPLSKTVHQLAHSGEVFINMHDVFGNVNLFVNQYNKHIDDETKDKLYILNEMSKDENYGSGDNKILSKSFQYVISPNNKDLFKLEKIDPNNTLEEKMA